MISLNGIEKLYRKGNTIVHALKGITLNVEQGEIFGILGRAGSGKSSLIRCINLLEYPSQGMVMVDSCDLTTLTNEDLREARRKIGMIFQHFNLLTSRTVFENVALPLEITKHSKSEIEALVRPLLALTHLEDFADAYPNQLNFGQKQCVAIARALVNKPKVLLCEEATAYLDVRTKMSILNLLKEINKQLNLTILFFTHEVEVIKLLCNRVAVLHQGEIVEQNEVVDFFTHPKSDMGREFIRGAARLDIPSNFRNRLRSTPCPNSNPIYYMTFSEPSKQESFITFVIQQFDLNVNIIQAHLETIKNVVLGVMVLEIVGEDPEIKKGIQFLENRGIHIEVLGYVTRTA